MTRKYVDGFVLTVPKKSLPAYKKLAKGAGKIWLEHGALDYYEAVGDDMKIPFGVPFPKLAQAKKNEVVIFAWITYKSRRHRDAVNKKVNADKRLMESCDPENMPFDCTRMSWGGFEIAVGASKKK